MKFWTVALAFIGSLISPAGIFAEDTLPNILIITVDDMNCDSVGAFGCQLPDTTPHIDRLAKSGRKFEHAHVVVGNCMPSRNVMWSGRYPHNNRVEGFYQVKDPEYPVLADLMKARGYFTAIRGKTSHSTPYQPYGWDMVIDSIDGEKLHIKDIDSYYQCAKKGIAASQTAGKPFCLMVNISDPHKPFYGVGKGGANFKDPHVPTRVFSSEEVPIPGFLFDDPTVRKELAQYYSSVRRADDCVGAVLKALEESQQTQNTLILFLSDHGMPLPFAKTMLYHHSTHTPLIVSWPGKIDANTMDRTHMVSAVDFLPTLLDVVGAKIPKGLDGRSFAPLLTGQPQDGRDMIFKEYNENSGGARHPMRSVQTKNFLYIFNPWSDGKRRFRTATQGTATYRRMKVLAENDPKMAARLQLFDFGVREQLYDIQADPDARRNLVDHPDHQEAANKLRSELLAWMERTNDPMRECFRDRDHEQAVQDYMTKVEKESADRRARKKPTRNRKNAKFIQLNLPKVATASESLEVTVSHTIPQKLGSQKIHITLKDGTGKRIDRKVLDAKGDGTVTATFQVPESVAKDKLLFAAFIGVDYQNHLQHLAGGPLAVESSAK